MTLNKTNIAINQCDFQAIDIIEINIQLEFDVRMYSY